MEIILPNINISLFVSFSLEFYVVILYRIRNDSEGSQDSRTFRSILVDFNSATV